jgi:hypothetical protein
MGTTLVDPRGLAANIILSGGYGALVTTSSSGATSLVQLQGYDGALWQNLAATDVAGDYALNVAVVSGGGSSVPTNLYSEQETITVAGTPQALGGSVAMSRVTVQAMKTNTGKIYLGNSSFQYTELDAGEAIDINIDDLSKVWFDADVSGEGINFIVEG